MVFVYCVWAGLGFNIVLFSGAMSRVPQEILEYNKLEGVGLSVNYFRYDSVRLAHFCHYIYIGHDVCFDGFSATVFSDGFRFDGAV